MKTAPWGATANEQLRQLWISKPPYVSNNDFISTAAKRFGRTAGSIRSKLAEMRRDGLIPRSIVRESTLPTFTDPPTHGGDVLVLPDVEVPYHHAEFINRVIDLAMAWKIETVILDGDFLHLDSLSDWGSEWVKEEAGSALPPKAEERLRNFSRKLSPKLRSELENEIEELGVQGQHDGFSTEMADARLLARSLGQEFKKIIYVLGNHEGRYLRRIGSDLRATEILHVIGVDEKPNWVIGPYYYAVVETERGTWQIEHQKDAGKTAARKLVNSQGVSVACAHSHYAGMTFSDNGKFLGYDIGHCADEARLAYTSQRHSGRPAHALGAFILRGGYPYLLSPMLTDWERMKKM